MKLSIIIPAFNEAATIRELLERVYRAPIDDIQTELIVIDDGSTDHTAKEIEAFVAAFPDCDTHTLTHEKNRGKGAAVKSGISLASGDIILIQDADLEYDPLDYPQLLEPVRYRSADVVYGSRFVGDKPHRVLYFWHYVANRMLTLLSNMFTNLNLTDMESCYKVFRAEVIKGIHLQEKRFGFEPEITAKMAKVPGVKVYEVGISYTGRTYEEGKKITALDGLHAIYCIFRYNMFP